MSVDQQVMDALRRHAPGLLSEPMESVTDRRGELRRRLADINANDLARVRACESKVQAIEDRQAKLREEQEAAEAEFRMARGVLSEAHGNYSEKRDAVWAELDGIPSEALKAFRREVEGRLVDLGSWARTWPGNVDRQVGFRVQTGNSVSLDAYAQALLHTKGGIDDAVHLGLDGEAAETAIAALRAKWPQVQIGRNEYVTPTWRD